MLKRIGRWVIDFLWALGIVIGFLQWLRLIEQ